VEKVLGSMLETNTNPIDQFEKILDSIIDEGENTLFSSDSEEQKQALDKLNQLMSKHFPAGINGVNGLESLEGIIDDANLNDQIREIGKKDSDACIRPLIYAYVQNKKPDMLKRIEIGDMKMSTEGNQFAQAVRKAKAAGMKPGDKFKVGDKEFTLKDAMDMAGISDTSLQDDADMDPNQSPQAQAYAGKSSASQEKEEVQKILNKHPNAYKQFKAGDDLYNHKELYSELANYYHDNGDMPYGTYTAKDGDPINWLTTRLADMGLIETTQKEAEASIDDQYRFRDWLKKTHNKEVHELKPQEYAIISKQYRDEKDKKESYHPGEGSAEELAKEIWNNTPALHDEYKDWKEYMDSEDFQMDSDKLRSKFESTGGGPTIRQMSDLELANFLHTTVAEVKKDREAAEEAAMELNQKYSEDNKSSKEDLHKASEKIEEFVKSFYDYTTNKFPKGETAVITSVQKQFGDSAAKTAIETIKSLQNGKDMEIERIKQLAGYSTKK
jgi:uncharacterized FlaG/YvyC family protein